MTSWLTIWSSAFILVFVIDPFGNIPLLLAILKNMSPKRQYAIILREMLIGLFLMIIFLFFGRNFLSLFQLETSSIRLAGGVIFFVIGLRMIFPDANKPIYADNGEPFIVPIAIPLIAGPSVLATLILMTQGHAQPQISVLISLLIAWVISCGILLLSPILYKFLRDRGLAALERLMGMLLLMLAVQMFIDGIRALSLF
ncbi:MAG TPA: MarC family protein [Treponemataceae bacterium]|nr:MarC family protein [Treponemataceae bacterium]